MTRCLVTGGRGFLGRFVVDRLRASGVDVFAPGRDELDILDPGAWARLPTDVDSVVHAAARVPAGAGDATENAEVLASTALGTERALAWSAAVGVRRFVYCSSWSVYAPPAALPLREDAPTGPTLHYALGKLWGEDLCRVWGPSFAARGASVTALRLSALYGPGMKGGVAAAFIGRAQAGLPLTVSAPGRTADFLFVADAADAIARAVTASRVSPVYNVGSGRETSLLELAGAAWAAAQPGEEPRIEVGTAAGPRLWLDPTRAREELGFAAAHDVAAGMQSWSHALRAGGSPG